MCSTPNDDVVDAEFAAIPADPLDYIPGLDVDNIKYDDLSHVGDEEVLDDAATIDNGSDDPAYEQQHRWNGWASLYALARLRSLVLTQHVRWT